MMKSLMHVGASLVLVFSAGYAQAQNFDKAFKDWNVFTLDQGGSKLCYIASAPMKKDTRGAGRDEPYMLITHRSAKVDEVSISFGFPYKEKSEVEMRVDKKRAVKFFTKGSLAWAYTEQADSAIVSQMKKGSTLVARASNGNGVEVTDRYSLTGVTAAYDRMKELCK